MNVPGLGAVGGGGSLGTLFVRLAADSTSLVNGTALAEKSVKRASLAIVGALAAIATAAVYEFAKFDKALTEAFSIMGDISEDMKKQMSDTARTIARESVKSAEDMAKSYYFLASAGLSAAEAMKALPVLTKFATAGNFQMARATDLLADAQSALGLRTKDVSQNFENMKRVADVITKANIQTNASVEQLSEALTNKAAAALRSVNKEVEEGVAVLGVFAEQGLKGEAAGEALNIVLRDLQVSSIANRKAFDELGVSVYDSAGNMNNMADIIGQMEKVLGSATVEQRRQILTLMGFQDRSVSATMSLIGFSDKIREYEKELRNAGGTTDKIANEQLKSFSSQVAITVNLFKDLLITIGEGLRPALDSLNGMLRDTSALNSASNESWKETARILGTILVGAVKTLVMIWEGLRDLAKVVAMLWLKVAETLVSAFIKAFNLLQTAMTGFLNFISDGINDWIDGVNILLDSIPEKVKKILNITPLKTANLSLGFEFIELEKMEEWLSLLKDARREINDSLIKTVIDAKETVVESMGAMTDATEMWGAAMGKAVGEMMTVEDDPDRAQRFLDSAKASAKLKEIGLPEQSYLGSDPFMGQAMGNMKEIEEGKSKLKMLEELNAQELKLTQDLQDQKTAAIEAYNDRLKKLQLAQTQILLNASESAFGQLSEAIKGFAGEQNAVYKAMFIASKAFAVADATIKIFQGIASAASLVYPYNLLAMASVIAATATIVSSITSVKLTLDGAKAAGGGVGRGKNYLVGERGPELFSPASNGSIIPNDRLGGGEVKVTVNNFTSARTEVTERTDGNQRVIEIAIRQIKAEMSAEIRDGRGDLVRSLEGSYGLKRGKGSKA